MVRERKASMSQNANGMWGIQLVGSTNRIGRVNAIGRSRSSLTEEPVDIFVTLRTPSSPWLRPPRRTQPTTPGQRHERHLQSTVAPRLATLRAIDLVALNTTGNDFRRPIAAST